MCYDNEERLKIECISMRLSAEKEVLIAKFK